MESDLRTAARLDSEGKCGEAEPYYQKALKAPHPSAALLNNAGNHYLLCGQPDIAQRLFGRLLKSNPAHTNANLQLARLAVGKREGATAVPYLNTLAKQPQGDVDLLSEVGALFAQIGEFGKAEAAFHTVLLKRPGDFASMLNYGKAAARAGRPDRARATLEAALKIQPRRAEALLELGLLHASTGDPARAVYLLAQARQQAPGRADITLALARAAEDAGFYGDSALAYDDYVQMKPQDNVAKRDRARVLGYTGTRLEEGLKEMAAYIARHPNDLVGHFNLAQFTWRDNPEESLQQLAMAIRLDPRFAPAHVSRAWLLHRLGRSADAISHLRQALEVTPKDVRALDLLGLVHLSLDQPKEAEQVLRRALAIKPDDAEVLLHLGRSLMAMDRAGEAQPMLERYQALRPRRQRAPRRDPGMIELATLPEAERRNREIERFRSLSRSRPDDPLLLLNLASLLLADGRNEAAIAEYRELLKAQPDAAICHQAGRSLLEAGEYGLAREFLERAVPERGEARTELALALLHAAGPGPALQAIDETPENARGGDFLLTKAQILDAAGRAGDAQQLLTDGLREASVRPEILHQAALLLVKHNREKDALELLEARAPTLEQYPDLQLARAAILGVANRDKESQAALRTIQARWPEWDLPYLVHGLLLERAGRGGEAAPKLRTAIALGSRDPAAHCALARLSSSSATDSSCACLADFRQWLLRSCDSK